MGEVKPITYSLQFRGRATPLAPNLVRFELTAPSAAVVTTIGAIGIRTRFDDVLGDEAVLRSETSFDEFSFDDRGTIEFGRGIDRVRPQVPTGRDHAVGIDHPGLLFT